MDNHHFSDTDLERILRTCRDRLDVPAMADVVPAAMNRIGQRPTPSNRADQVVAAGQSAPVLTEETGEPARQTGGVAAPAARTLDPPRSRTRDLLGIAAAALAVALVGGILVVLFQDRESSQEPAADTINQLVPDPYEIEGFEFVQEIGGPSFPNQPADTVVGEDGTVYVADLGINRVLAFDEDGELETSWGDGGMSEELAAPVRLALDGDGNLYAVEYYGNSVQKFDPSGTPTTSWTLTDEEGVSVVGGQRTTEPTGIAVDGDGNVYVAERHAKQIEKFDSTGQLLDTWDLLTGWGSSSGITNDIAIDGRDRIYVPSQIPGEGTRVLDTDGELVEEWETGASSLAIRDGTVYALVGAHQGYGAAYKIRRSDLDGNLISEHPVDVAPVRTRTDRLISPGVDADGNVYLGDAAGQRVVAFGQDGDVVREITGEDSQSGFGGLTGVEVNGDGHVYGTDPVTSRVLKFDSDGEHRATFDVHSDTSRSGTGIFVGAIAVADDGTVYVAYQEGSKIAVFSPDSEKVDEWDLRGEQSGEEAQASPADIALDGQGHLYVLEQAGATIQKYTTDGEFLNEWPYGQEDESIDGIPLGLTVVDGTVYALTYGAIRTFDLEGNPLDVVAQFETTTTGEEPPDEILSVMRLAVDPEGNAYVTGARFRRNQEAVPFEMQKFSPNGEPLQTSELWQYEQRARQLWQYDLYQAPIDIAVRPDGRLYLTDPANRRILVYEPATDEPVEPDPETTPAATPEEAETTATTPAPTEQSVVPSRPFELDGYEFAGALGGSTVPNKPTDVVAGPDGRTFVADVGASRVLAFDQEGELIDGWGPDGLGMSAIIDEPTGLALDDAGNLYVAESGNARLTRLDPDGQTVDSWPLPDNVDGNQFVPMGLAIDGQGDIYLIGSGVMRTFTPDGDLLDSRDLGDTRLLDIAIDSRNRIYVTTASELRIFDRDGELLASWSGLQIGEPEGNLSPMLAIDADDNVFVVSYPSSSDGTTTVYKIGPDGEMLSEWTFDIQHRPRSVTAVFPGSPGIDGQGNLYIPDSSEQRVVKVSPDGETFGEIGGDDRNRFAGLTSITIDRDGNLYAVDPVRERILGFGPDGQIRSAFDMNRDGPPFMPPQTPDIAVGPEGTIYATDPAGSFVLQYDPAGELVNQWGGIGFEDEELLFPHAIAIDSQQRLYLIDDSATVKIFGTDGEHLGVLSETLTPMVQQLASIAIVNDMVYVSVDDEDGAGIEVYDLEGNHAGTVVRFSPPGGEDGLDGIPQSLAVDEAGNVYIPMAVPPSGQGTGFVSQFVKVGPEGELLANAEIGPRDGLIYTAVGPGGTVYITDPLTKHVLVYEPVE